MYRALLGLLCLLAVMPGPFVAAFIPKPDVPQPDEDRCVRTPCRYSGDALIPAGYRGAFISSLLGMDYGDHLTFRLRNVTCEPATPPCPQLSLLVLDAPSAEAFAETGAVPPEPIVSIPRLEVGGVPEERSIEGAFARGYVVLRTANTARNITARWTLTYKVATCVEFITGLIFAMALPLLILLLLYVYVSEENKKKKLEKEKKSKEEQEKKKQEEEQKQQTAGASQSHAAQSADEAGPEAQVISEETKGGESKADKPPAKECCSSCERCCIPNSDSVGCCDAADSPTTSNCFQKLKRRWFEWKWDLPAAIFTKPKVHCQLYCLQNIPYTWIWNPDEESKHINRLGRFMLVYMCTSINLLILTTLADASLDSTPKEDQADGLFSNIGALGVYYLILFVKTGLMVVLVPLLKMALRNGAPLPLRPPAGEKCWPHVGEALFSHLLHFIWAAAFATAVVFTILLFLSYRCSVLVNSVVIPFFAFEAGGNFLKFGAIPLPLWHAFLWRYGFTEDDQAAPDGSADKTAAAAAPQPSASPVESGNPDTPTAAIDAHHIQMESV